MSNDAPVGDGTPPLLWTEFWGVLIVTAGSVFARTGVPPSGVGGRMPPCDRRRWTSSQRTGLRGVRSPRRGLRRGARTLSDDVVSGVHRQGDQLGAQLDHNLISITAAPLAHGRADEGEGPGPVPPLPGGGVLGTELAPAV